jgi:hypothetical protein
MGSLIYLNGMREPMAGVEFVQGCCMHVLHHVGVGWWLRSPTYTCRQLQCVYGLRDSALAMRNQQNQVHFLHLLAARQQEVLWVCKVVLAV